MDEIEGHTLTRSGLLYNILWYIEWGQISFLFDVACALCTTRNHYWLVLGGGNSCYAVVHQGVLEKKSSYKQQSNDSKSDGTQQTKHQ